MLNVYVLGTIFVIHIIQIEIGNKEINKFT